MPAETKVELKRSLGFWALTACGVGDIFGAGIYALVGKIAGIAGKQSWISFAIAMGVAGLTALSYAELARRYPKSSGEAQFAQQGFRSAAFALFTGWLVLCSGLVSIAAISHAFAGYLLAMLPSAPVIAEPLTIVAFLFTLALVTFWGIRQTSLANIVCTLIETFGLMVVIAAAAAFLWGGGEPANEVSRAAIEATGGVETGWIVWLAIAQAAGLAFFAFTGFEDMVNIAEEVKDPERNLPAAIMTALLATGGVYILVVWLATMVVPRDVLSESDAPLLEVVRIAAPGVPPWLFTLIALFAVGNTALLNFLMGSRLLYGMSRQGLLPGKLSEVHGATRTPHWAVVTIFLIAVALALSGSLLFLAGTTSILVLIIFLIVNCSLIAVKRRPDPVDRQAGGFEVPVAVSACGACACLILVFFLPAESMLRASVLIAAGVIAVAIWKARAAGV